MNVLRERRVDPSVRQSFPAGGRLAGQRSVIVHPSLRHTVTESAPGTGT
jgi:hypothetical protein